MARTILCPHCKSTFDESVLAKRSEPNICPVCEKSLLIDSGESSNDEVLSFGEGVELGEDDSFDEDKIDFWWYSIIEPGEVWEGITFKNGEVSTNCAKCGHFVGSAPYPIARTKDYLLIDPRFTDKCSHCGNEMKNHILSKRPSDWVDPRKHDILAKDYDNLPKCPTCSSTNIKKITVTSKAASVAMWGVLSRKVHKQWHCNVCGSEW